MKKCSLCEKPLLAIGYCRKHYDRNYKHGNPNIVFQRRGEPSLGKRGYLVKWDSTTKKVRTLHRIIMEQHLGRPLDINEHIHHINGNKLDNRIENLEITDNKTHTDHHRKLRWIGYKGKPCVICGHYDGHNAQGYCGKHYQKMRRDGLIKNLK